MRFRFFLMTILWVPLFSQAEFLKPLHCRSTFSVQNELILAVRSDFQKIMENKPDLLNHEIYQYRIAEIGENLSIAIQWIQLANHSKSPEHYRKAAEALDSALRLNDQFSPLETITQSQTRSGLAPLAFHKHIQLLIERRIIDSGLVPLRGLIVFRSSEGPLKTLIDNGIESYAPHFSDRRSRKLIDFDGESTGLILFNGNAYESKQWSPIR